MDGNRADKQADMQWLRPEVSHYPTLDVAAQVWQLAPSPIILALSTLAAVSYLSSFDNSPTIDTDLVKAKLLHEINERVTTRETATAYGTMSALVILVCFELSRGNQEAVMHLHGLKQIVELCEPSRPMFSFKLEL